MNDAEFAGIVTTTKKIVLSAIEKNLYDRFFFAIDDIVQETYLRAYRSLVAKKFRYESELSTWIYTIARNETIRMNQKFAREEEKIKKYTESLVRKETEVIADEPDMEVYRQMIKRLPQKYRDVIELYDKGFTEKEVAGSLQLKIGTVKSRTFRGKEILMKLMHLGGNNG
ncbi:MAG: sigma-70 family RNA polymerase sigma factor [Leptospira sp.]|nr:sigma-70 family RNA polymerase sigma factor [Leptospira sp.]